MTPQFENTAQQGSPSRTAGRSRAGSPDTNGHEPEYALADIARINRPWAISAVEAFRDANTVERTKRYRSLTITATRPEIRSHGATNQEIDELPAATRATKAESVRIIEKWNETDRSAARKPTPPTASIVLTKVSTVARRHADWLWTTARLDPFVCGVSAELIPLHGLTLIAGREQAAKSTLAWWLAAQITLGKLPGHYAGQPRDVIILATEDTEMKIRLRLEAAGADLDRVYLPAKRTGDGIALPISIRDDIDQLTELVAGLEPGAVFLDPLKDFLGDGVNTDREDEVRPVLTPLLDLTKECDAPVIGLHHLNKSLKGDFLTRLTGSGAFKNVSRSVLGVAHDTENGLRVLQQMKSNDGELGRGAFQARVLGVEITVDGRTEKVGKWVMDGVSLSDLDSVLTAKEQGGRGPSAADRAVAFLRGRLGDGEPHPSDEIKAAATAQLNISVETVKRAFREIGGTSTRTSEKPSRTLWQLRVDEETS